MGMQMVTHERSTNGSIFNDFIQVYTQVTSNPHFKVMILFKVK